MSYKLWDRFKDLVVKPIFQAVAVVGVVLGVIHMFKARREESKKGGEG